TVRLSLQPVSLTPMHKPAARATYASAAPTSTNPTTGSAACCARAMNDHAPTVPPKRVMKSRRLILLSPRLGRSIVAPELTLVKRQNRMSALGQKQTYAAHNGMSAL